MYTRIHILAAAVVGAAAGAATGYILARKLLEAKYEKMYQEEIAVQRTYSSMFRKEGAYESPITTAEAFGVVPPPPTVKTTAAAEELVRGLGYRGEKTAAAEVLTRNRNRPYLLREDEFMENDSGFDQVQLTYFAGDDTLMHDLNEDIEPDVEHTVGKANLDCFGQISGDPNVLFVRNEKLRVEYEVTRDERMYKEVVTGL